MTETQLPLLQVPSVELPPPATSAPRTPPLAFRALVSVLLLVGLFVLAFGIIGGLIWVNTLAFRSARLKLQLLIITVVVVLAVGRGLMAMVRTPPEPTDEVEVPAAEEPELHARLTELARVVGTRPPDRVVVTSDVNAYVREFGPMMGLARGTRTLAIGTPLLDVLTVAQLEAVLAHELGHLAGGDTRLGPIAFRTDAATMHMIAALEGSVIRHLFIAYGKFQHRVSAAVRRGQELVADRAAVQIAGRQAAADALHRIGIAARAEGLYFQAYLVPLLEAGARPADLASGLRELLRDPQRTEELAADAASADEPVDPWATHPPTPQRIARIAALTDPAGIDVDDRPARALWRDPDRWSRAAYETWLHRATRGSTDFRTVGWESWGDETAGRIQRQRAAVVDSALGKLGLPAGLAGLRQAIADGRGAALAGDLIAAGWRAPGDEERETILTVAIVASGIRDVLAAGGQFRFSWSEPMRLTDRNGERLRVGELADIAIAGDWEPLLEAVAAAGPEGDSASDLAAAPAAGAATGPTGPTGPSGATDRTAPTGSTGATAPAAPVGRGRPAVPRPPSPPFQASSGDWLWEAELGRLGNRAKLAIGEHWIAFDGQVAGYDDIASVSMKIESGFELRMVVKIGLSSGKRLKLAVGGTGADGKAAIESAFGYLWDLFRYRVGPRLRADAVAALEAGGEAQVGPLTLARAGITSKPTGRQQVPWARIHDAVIDGGNIRILLADGKSADLAVDVDNAFVLEDLVPELRARYA